MYIALKSSYFIGSQLLFAFIFVATKEYLLVEYIYRTLSQSFHVALDCDAAASPQAQVCVLPSNAARVISFVHLHSQDFCLLSPTPSLSLCLLAVPCLLFCAFLISHCRLHLK